MKTIKKIICLFIVFFTGITISNASTQTFDRQQLNNYGVNKKWNINSNNLSNVLNTYKVDASEKIYDYSDILTDEEEKELYDKINKFISKTNIDMVFVSVDLPYYSDKTNEDFAADFYDYNDFGMDFKNYSGVLLLRNTYEKDPYFNIYTFGDAQLYFSYNRLERTLDYIYSDFHSGYYYDGIDTFINRMTSYYNSGIPNEMKGYKVNEDGYLYKIYRVPFIPVILISGIITLISTLIMVHKNKMVFTAKKATEYLDKSTINYTNKQDNFITSHTSSYVMSSSSGGSGGGSSHSSGGSSGGGHSSGGGRHG